jgi:hypothetical protein
LAAPAIRPKSRQQCASESGEVLEIRNRFSFKDHAAVMNTPSVSTCRAQKSHPAVFNTQCNIVTFCSPD